MQLSIDWEILDKVEFPSKQKLIKIEQNRFSRLINELASIDDQDISKIVQGDSYNNWKLNPEELRAIVGIEVDNEPLDLDEINLLPSNLQRAIKRFIDWHHVTLSKLISNGERNHLGEKSDYLQLCPFNDACHMRLVVNDMKNRGVGDMVSTRFVWMPSKSSRDFKNISHR